MDYIVLRSRSRFAPSLGSGSITKTSHCDIFSAQDDIYKGRRGRRLLQSSVRYVAGVYDSLPLKGKANRFVTFSS